MTETFLFLLFSFTILREKQQMIFFKKNNFIPEGFFYERKGVSPDVFPFLSKTEALCKKFENLTLKNQPFLMMLKLSVLNNINIKKITRNKVVNVASPKSSLTRPSRAFSVVFSCSRKSNKVWWRGLLTLHHSVNKIPCSH